MTFISVRELRGKSADVWKRLEDERELVVTSNGKPIAILSATSPDGLERSLRALRSARAIAAVESMQTTALEKGLDKLSDKEIEREIAAARRKRRV
jgi:prevent-host-death family protein